MDTWATAHHLSQSWDISETSRRNSGRDKTEAASWLVGKEPMAERFLPRSQSWEDSVFKIPQEVQQGGNRQVERDEAEEAEGSNSSSCKALTCHWEVKTSPERP